LRPPTTSCRGSPWSASYLIPLGAGGCGGRLCSWLTMRSNGVNPLGAFLCGPPRPRVVGARGQPATAVPPPPAPHDLVSWVPMVSQLQRCLRAPGPPRPRVVGARGQSATAVPPRPRPPTTSCRGSPWSVSYSGVPAPPAPHDLASWEPMVSQLPEPVGGAGGGAGLCSWLTMRSNGVNPLGARRPSLARLIPDAHERLFPAPAGEPVAWFLDETVMNHVEHQLGAAQMERRFGQNRLAVCPMGRKCITRPALPTASCPSRWRRIILNPRPEQPNVGCDGGKPNPDRGTCGPLATCGSAP